MTDHDCPQGRRNLGSMLARRPDRLAQEATVRLFRIVQKKGDREVVREVEFYKLDMVLAPGFRVRSPVAMRFRQWVADKLKEYIVKGFVLDDERLKNPDHGVYFEQLLERIRDIRSSEKVFWRKALESATKALPKPKEKKK